MFASSKMFLSQSAKELLQRRYGQSRRRGNRLVGDNVIAAALLDRLLHHAIVIEIEGNSYRLREHAALVPESMKGRRQEAGKAPAKRRGRPPKNMDRDLGSLIIF